MLCRLLLTAIAFSYLICVLVLSGMQKEDLDLNLLRKLQRHGVDTEELNNEKLRQECLSEDNLDDNKPIRINEQKTSTVVPFTITDASQTKGNDILHTLDEIDMETVIKYFKSTQKTDTPIPQTDTPHTEKIIFMNPTHTTQESDAIVKNTAKVTEKTLVNDTSNSPIIEYQEDKPKLDSVLNFWQMLIKKNTPEKIIYVTTKLPETMTDIITDLEQNSPIYKINPTKRSLNYGRYELPAYGNSYSDPEPTTSSIENINSKEVEKMSKIIAAYLSRKRKKQMQYPMRQKRKEDVNNTTHQVIPLEKPQNEQNETKSSFRTSSKSDAMQQIQEFLEGKVQDENNDTSSFKDIFIGKADEKSTLSAIIDSSPTNSPINHENYFKDIPMSLIDAKINSELEQRINSKLKSFSFDSEPVTSNTPFKTQFQIDRQESYKYDNEQKEFNREPFIYTDVYPPKPKNDNFYSKPERADHVNKSGMQLSSDVIKQIAETVKEIVLKEVRKEITTTSSSTTTTTTPATTTQSTTLSRKADVMTTDKKVDEDKLQRATQAIEKFIKLLENFKPVKELPATRSADVTVTTTTESNPEKFRIKVMYPQVGAVNPYGIPGQNQVPKFPPIFTHPYIDPLNSQIPLAPMNIFPISMQRAPMVHILQDKPHQQPVMIQTNGEIPPLQIPIMEPVLLNRHIVLTTQLPKALTDNERERWNYIMKYGRNPDTRDERQKRIETLSGYSNNVQNQRNPESERGSIRYDTNTGGTLMNRSPFNENYRNHDNNNRKISDTMQAPASQKRVQDIRGFHERLEGNVDWNRDSYPFEHKNYNEPKERYMDRKELYNEPKERYNEPKEGYNSPTEGFVEQKGKEYSKNIDVVSRQQVSLNNKRGSKFDDTHFQNFLKTQQKVNDMLERILSGGKANAARSVEIP